MLTDKYLLRFLLISSPTLQLSATPQIPPPKNPLFFHSLLQTLPPTYSFLSCGTLPVCQNLGGKLVLCFHYVLHEHSFVYLFISCTHPPVHPSLVPKGEVEALGTPVARNPLFHHFLCTVGDRFVVSICFFKV